ncbi:MAG: GntR family transcriptional regulator [Candidatus Anaerobiospirillum merdipullorum]|uniref:GntR family transcriptional regulator n=1 Tax=Candidatus Anaerobiospirillum merdipullorum TaxID=2838450 RepID=A0A9E2KMD8_9GAMM|nr:GntR family transcriptional regulator [Candidatus Anaerobiospirillum merdipullorum]
MSELNAPRRTGTTPSSFYVTIALTLRREILQGLWDERPFATEQELSTRFHVTRTTVRRALDRLKEEGLIIKHQGKRLQIALQPLKRTSWNFSSFSESMRSRHDTPYSRVDVAQIEELADGTYFHLVRTRGICRARSVQYLTREDSHLPLNLFPHVERFDFATLSLYDIMRREYHIYPTRGLSRLTAILPDDSLCRDFAITAQQPLLQAHQEICDQEGRLIERVIITYAPSLEICIARDAGH